MVQIHSKPANLLHQGMFPYAFNSILDSFFDESKQKFNPVHFVPAADIIERVNEFEIMLSLPGMKKEDIKISLDGDHLTVEGERSKVQTEENSKYLKNEISTGKFSRSFTIGNTDSAAIDARFEDGILHIRLPKQAEEKPSLIPIK